MSNVIEKQKSKMTANQAQILMKRFQAKPQLEKGEQHQLAKSLNVSEKRIEDWYSNTRFKRRRQGLLPEGEDTQQKM